MGDWGQLGPPGAISRTGPTSEDPNLESALHLLDPARGFEITGRIVRNRARHVSPEAGLKTLKQCM